MADVAPEIKWLSKNKYRNLKIVVEIDSAVKAQSAAKRELRRRHKAVGSLRIVTGRGLQVSVQLYIGLWFCFNIAISFLPFLYILSNLLFSNIWDCIHLSLSIFF